ncbi:hypothetical protein CI102_9840 [Trichoderma harzianum]|nr:hypothetical protein CI102_9840 [Trichoderma harzianum]
MTTPCSLGLPNLNSPSPPPSFLVLFLLPLWLICVGFNLVPCADSFFFLRFRYDGRSDYWQSHKSGSPASFLPSSPCCLFRIFLATSTLFILLVHTYPPPTGKPFSLVLPSPAFSCHPLRRYPRASMALVILFPEAACMDLVFPC